MRLAALVVVLAACAGAPPPAASRPPAVIAPDHHAEIESLFDQLDDARQQMSLPAPAPNASAPAAQPYSTPVSSTTDRTCHPAQTQTCTDTCKLSDTICDNADKICKLAAGLVGDAWAAGKCDTAKQTCETAHVKCCTCAT